MPHDVRLGDPVQEQQRRTFATATSVNRGSENLDVELVKSVEHCVLALARAARIGDVDRRAGQALVPRQPVVGKLVVVGRLRDVDVAAKP